MGVRLLSKMSGSWIWSENPGECLSKDLQWKAIGSLLGLSNREREVCELLFHGRNRNQISDDLGLKFSTVRQYVEQIHDKLRVNSRVGLVLRVIQVRDHLKSENSMDRGREFDGR